MLSADALASVAKLHHKRLGTIETAEGAKVLHQSPLPQWAAREWNIP